MPDLIFGFFIGVASTLLLSGLVLFWLWYENGAPLWD